MQRPNPTTLPALPVLLLVAACSTSPNTRYPEGWPERLQSTDSCEHLSGEYVNAAVQHEAFTRDIGPRYKGLSYVLGKGAFGEQYRTIDSVVLEVGQNSLRARSRVRGNVSQWISFDAADWSCTNGVLSAASTTWAKDEFETVDAYAVELSATVDGSLIVNMSERESGALLVVPTSSSKRFWNRHERIAQ